MGSSTCDGRCQLFAWALQTTRVGEPDAGNLHVRFDEGEQLIAAPYSTDARSVIGTDAGISH